MTKKEDYEIIVKMIDDTQRQIDKEPRDKRQLILELELLQQDLALLRMGGHPQRKYCIQKKGVPL